MAHRYFIGFFDQVALDFRTGAPVPGFPNTFCGWFDFLPDGTVSKGISFESYYGRQQAALLHRVKVTHEGDRITKLCWIKTYLDRSNPGLQRHIRYEVEFLGNLHTAEAAEGTWEFWDLRTNEALHPDGVLDPDQAARGGMNLAWAPALTIHRWPGDDTEPQANRLLAKLNRQLD